MKHPLYRCRVCGRRFFRSMVRDELCRGCRRAIESQAEMDAEALAAAERDAA